MLTYSDLKNIYHTEKKTSSLSKLNDNFYLDVQELLAQVEDVHREHLSKLLSEIYEKRKEKLMINAARSHRPENLIPVEDKLYSEIAGKIENFRSNVLSLEPKTKSGQSGDNAEAHDAVKPEKIRVRFIQNMPAIVGSDLVRYEIKENDEVELPETDAKILVENKIAIRI